MGQTLASAVEDFHRARLQAKLEDLVGHLTGRSTELLSYEDVRHKLRARRRPFQRVDDIALNSIVGSVGRYKDFTRSFLPRHASSRDRWANVEVAVTGMEGVPPIEVYKIGEAYFVRDGHHRVSVARQMGADRIQAYVTEVETEVPLSPEVEPDELIIKAEYAEFLARTRVQRIRPDADLRVTEAGKYPVLEEHIDVHRHFRGLEQEQHIPYEEAVAHWYDEVYSPLVRLVRQQGILRDFPERTETDLYLWLSEHRAVLEEELGWQVSPAMAADDLAARFSRKPNRVLERIGRKALDAVTPSELEPGPAPGRWREERQPPRRGGQMFPSILVAVRGDESGWSALEQALVIAHREGADLKGLHVLPSEEQAERAETQAVREIFDRRCVEAGIKGTLVFGFGTVDRVVCERARWADLVVLSLDHPPRPQVAARLGSGLVSVIRRCPTPLLTVPRSPSPLNHALLAYDGSAKAQEALFVATYVASRWGVLLTVLTVDEGSSSGSETLAQARHYLEIHGVQPQCVEMGGDESEGVAQPILATAGERGCDFILMGGYGKSPLVEVVLGSAVDRVLRESPWPTLICR